MLCIHMNFAASNGFVFLQSVSVCEYAFSLSQNLDPASTGTGVLQFKTGLLAIIKVQPEPLIIYHLLQEQASVT